MDRLDKKIAVVTGASSGIGYATAKAYAKEGATVLCCARTKKKLDDLVQSIKEQGGQAEAHELDVSEEEQIKTFADTVKTDFGKVDILFNNAGIDQMGGKLHEYPVQLFDDIINTDLRGTFLVSKYLIPLMLDDGGSIINVTSFSAVAGDLDRSGYNAAKGAVDNMTKTMAIDYGRSGIRVNSLAPGTIETPLIDKLAGTKEEESGKQFREAQKWVTPLGRLGTPDEMASVALFLASSESSFITGQTIIADGGVMAYTWPGKMLFEEGWKETTE